MALTNYWWLLIWMFTGVAILAVYVPKKTEVVNGKKVLRWKPFAAFLAVIPYVIWAGFRTDSFGDTGSYRLMFQRAPIGFSNIYSYVLDAKKDKGFSVLIILFKTIVSNSDIVFFLVLALFQMACMIYIYRKYSCNYWLSIFLFVAMTDYMSWMHNGIRQFIAVTIIFASSELIIKKKYVLVILLVLLASTFHASALLMLPAIFIMQGKAWNKKTLLAIGVALIALLMIDKFTGILDSMLSETQYSNMVTDWKTWGDDGTSPIRVIVYSIPTILSLIGLKKIREEDDPMINLAVNSSICSTLIYIISIFTSGIFVGRLPAYFQFLGAGILLPWELNRLFTRESKRVLYFCAILAYIFFFYYQMHFIWRIM